jgi:hypothetical protein
MRKLIFVLTLAGAATWGAYELGRIGPPHLLRDYARSLARS